MDDIVVKVATSLCGGTANQFLGSCGALAGGVMVLDYYFGRPAAKISFKEQIENNLEALFSAFENPEALAEGILKALSCTWDRSYQSNFIKQFSNDRLAEKIINVYEDVLGQK